MSPENSGQKTAFSKCGDFFFLDPDTDMSLLEMKHSFLALREDGANQMKRSVYYLSH